MKRSVVILFVSIVILSLCLTACQTSSEYTPTGEFYKKTSPARGDAGVSNVISLEAECVKYEYEGDVTVPMTVGFGHLPGLGGYGEDVGDTFYVIYRIIEAPWAADKEPIWEKKVEYSESWYSPKFDSTEQTNRSFLIFPHYGEFYPKYTETVEIVFPDGVEKGYLQVQLFAIVEGFDDHQFFGMEIYFEHIDGLLNLDPR